MVAMARATVPARTLRVELLCGTCPPGRAAARNASRRNDEEDCAGNFEFSRILAAPIAAVTHAVAITGWVGPNRPAPQRVEG